MVLNRKPSPGASILISQTPAEPLPYPVTPPADSRAADLGFFPNVSALSVDSARPPHNPHNQPNARSQDSIPTVSDISEGWEDGGVEPGAEDHDFTLLPSGHTSSTTSLAAKADIPAPLRIGGNSSRPTPSAEDLFNIVQKPSQSLNEWHEARKTPSPQPHSNNPFQRAASAERHQSSDHIGTTAGNDAGIWNARPSELPPAPLASPSPPPPPPAESSTQIWAQNFPAALRAPSAPPPLPPSQAADAQPVLPDFASLAVDDAGGFQDQPFGNSESAAQSQQDAIYELRAEKTGGIFQPIELQATPVQAQASKNPFQDDVYGGLAELESIGSSPQPSEQRTQDDSSHQAGVGNYSDMTSGAVDTVQQSVPPSYPPPQRPPPNQTSIATAPLQPSEPQGRTAATSSEPTQSEPTEEFFDPPPGPPPRKLAYSGAEAEAIQKRLNQQRSESYEIKHIRWLDPTSSELRTTPIMVQNANGPCPLLALVNALTLTTPMNVDTALIETLRVRENVSLGLLLDAVFDELMSGRRGGAAQELPDVTDLYSFLITLHTGMNVNPRFIQSSTQSSSLLDAFEDNGPPSAHEARQVGGFEDTREMKLYGTFSIPLIHGWLPPPTQPVYHALARSANTYEDAQNLMFREEELEDKLQNMGLNHMEQQLLEDIATIKYFLSSSATQLTGYGLDTINDSLTPGTIAILFRNDHFSTLYKHPRSGQILTLVTDMGYAGHEEVVWESLVDVNGEGSEFFSGDFRPVGHQANLQQSTSGVGPMDRRRSSQTPRSPINTVRSQDEYNLPSPRNTEQEDADLALAMQLQEEEEDRSRRSAQARQREDELSQAYLSSQVSNTSNTSNGNNSSGNTPANSSATRRPRNGPASPRANQPLPPLPGPSQPQRQTSRNALRRSNPSSPIASTPTVNSLIPPSTPAIGPAAAAASAADDDDDPNAPPPSYEQASRSKPYLPNSNGLAPPTTTTTTTGTSGRTSARGSINPNGLQAQQSAYSLHRGGNAGMAPPNPSAGRRRSSMRGSGGGGSVGGGSVNGSIDDARRLERLREAERERERERDCVVM